MNRQELIRESLKDLERRSQETAEGWVTFEANDQEHWLQYSLGVINMDWPFTCPPEKTRVFELFEPLDPSKPNWEPDTYLTFNLGNPAVETLALVIDRVFQEFYELGPEYDLNCTME